MMGSPEMLSGHCRSLRERVAELERQSRAQEWAWQDRLVATETELNEVRRQMEHTLTTLTSSQEDFQHRCSPHH